MSRSARTTTRSSAQATIAGLSALVVLSLVLQTSAPATVAAAQAGSPIPRAAQPRHEIDRRVLAERPTPAQPATPGRVTCDSQVEIVAAEFRGTCAQPPPMDAARQGRGGLAPPMTLA